MRAEDEEALTDYIKAAENRMYRFARLQCNDATLAEDVLQDALKKFYPHWRRVSKEGNPDSYLRRIIVNEFKTMARRKRFTHETPHNDPTELDTTISITPDLASQHALEMQIREALARLDPPPERRAAVVMAYCEDLPVSTIAEVLNYSVGHVNRLLRDSRAQLRVELKGVTA